MDSFVENEERPGEPWRIPLHFYLCDVPGEQSVSSLETSTGQGAVALGFLGLGSKGSLGFLLTQDSASR